MNGRQNESPEVTTSLDSSCGRLDALQAKVAAMGQTLCRMRDAVDEIKEAFRIQKKETEEAMDFGRLTLLEESISDVFIAVHRESDARQKQVSDLHSSLRQYDRALQERVERFAEKVDSGLDGLTGLADLKPLSLKVQALETKSGTLARLVKLIAEQACANAAGCTGLRCRSQDWASPEEIMRWLGDGMENAVMALPQQEELSTSDENKLRGKVRRLVQQFGGSPRSLFEEALGSGA